MEGPGPPGHQDLQLLLQAVEGHVQQGPVPVVVVKVAELLGARVDPAPQLAVEGHTHVVLGADPLGDLNLISVEERIDSN